MDFSTVISSIDTTIGFAATLVGYIGIAIMLHGALKNGWKFLICSIRHSNHLPEIRIDLGKHLALGLEFLVGKDIINSIMEPSWDDLGKLAVIVALRTVVAFVLSWELKDVRQELAIEKKQMKAVRLLKRKKG